MFHFFKHLKIGFICIEIFLMLLIVPASISNAIHKEWGLVLMGMIGLIFMNAIMFILFLYYKNIVVEAAFENDNAVIKTNGKIYVLPNKYFTEVNDSKSMGRIFITYADGQTKKTFIFQKRYSPFKVYSLDLVEMRKHMSLAVFKES